MKREIKFRVFDKISKEMYGWSKIESISLVDFNRKHYELMQFTGLTDKNGVEIFEGDIVMHGSAKTKSKIEFIRGSFALNNEKTMHNTCIRHYELNVCEVIGNICENPGLL
jgi:uncharacterized phage protein (TIGR01671 family)